jgi:hypothetical protein
MSKQVGTLSPMHKVLAGYAGKNMQRKGDFGIELECEFLPQGDVILPNVDMIFNDVTWKATEDGSLRNVGIEYVTDKCYHYNEGLEKSLRELVTYVKNPKYKADPASNRTSLHVHSNITNLNIIQVWTYLVASWILEPVMVSYCGETRKGNHFCLGVSDAESIVFTLEHTLQNTMRYRPFYDMRLDYKYSATNVVPICKQGSIEHRSMSGLLDADRFANWLKIIYQMKEAATTQFADPAELADFFIKATKEDILDCFFDKDIQKLLTEAVGDQDIYEVLTQNVNTVLPVAYCEDFMGWKKYGEWIEDYYVARARPRKTTTTVGNLGAIFVERGAEAMIFDEMPPVADVEVENNQ